MTKRLFLLLVLASIAPSPLRAWSVDELVTDSKVPDEIAARWTSPFASEPGANWDKLYLRDEFGDERTLFCHHQECDAARQAQDSKERVALYYLASSPPQGIENQPDITYWRAILSSYAIRFEKHKAIKGVATEMISRPGTPLAITPQRPFQKDDPWSLPGQVVVLPPIRREVPPTVSPMSEVVDWPWCLGLDPASYQGSAGTIKQLHPMEIEIKEAAADRDEMPELANALKSIGTEDGAVQKIRAEARATADRQLKLGHLPKDRFNTFEARFLYCRARHWDSFNVFKAELKQTKELGPFIAKWRHFVRAELAAYQKRINASHNYQRELIALEERTIVALGGTPYMARMPGVAPRPEEMKTAAERVNLILEEAQ